MSMNPDNPTGSSSLGSSSTDMPSSADAGSSLGAGPGSNDYTRSGGPGGSGGTGHTADGSDSPFPRSDDLDSGSAQGSQGELLKRMVHGAHQTIDRLADAAAPHVERLEQSMGSAGDKLHERADEWTDTVRTTVREHPLAAVATALALGVLVARLAR